jgi:hypothetical protein
MLSIPLQAVPSQSLSITLDGQAAEINVYQLGTPPYTHMYFDLTESGQAIVTCRIIRGYGNLPNTQPQLLLEDAQYQGFEGDFILVDTLASPTVPALDPEYTGLGSRWQLIYVEASDLEQYGL